MTLHVSHLILILADSEEMNTEVTGFSRNIQKTFRDQMSFDQRRTTYECAEMQLYLVKLVQSLFSAVTLTLIR